MTDEVENEETEGLILDADGYPLCDLYHDAGTIRTNLPDGCYISMPEAVYFAQDRLGSSDLKVLSTDDAEDWWWGSKNNPDREQSDGEEDLLTGKGIHCLTLEGEAAFDRQFVKSPYDSYTSKKAKDWKAEQIANGLTPVKAKTYKNILLMSNLMINHPVLGPKLRGGLTEVTILFTVGGIKFRARLDKLLTEEIIDLKSAGRHKQSMASSMYLKERGVSRDVMTCLRIIRDLRYSGQRYLYSISRTHMREFVKNHREEAPLVHGASPAQMKWLVERFLPIDSWNFTFLFFRKISHSSKNPAAPIITPIICQPGDFTDQKGFEFFESACANYERLVGQFTLDVGWGRLNQPVIIDDSLLVELFGPNENNPEKLADPDSEEYQFDEDGVVLEGEDK